MKRLVPLALLCLMACGRSETIRSSLVISNKPSVVVGTESKLQVPDVCPLYIPGGGEQDPTDNPLPNGCTGICAVDDQGNAYGILSGDEPTSPPVAILPGGHELGIYVGLAPGWFPDEPIIFTGALGNLEAWAAPDNVLDNRGEDCCPESDPDAQIPVEVVAGGREGFLFSLGTFNSSPIQVVAVTGGGGDTLPTQSVRFYVNGAP
jgi:hypothetical protein